MEQNKTLSTTIINNYMKNKSPFFIDKTKKIKYVAIGDSVTAGFDGTLARDYPGEMQNDEIIGISYPAFLARLLNQDNRVEAFINYSASGSRIADWIKMLELNYDNSNNDLPDWDDVDRAFRVNKGGAKQIVASAIKELKQANLVTILIGANDFFYLFFKAAAKSKPFELIQELNNKSPDYQKICDYIVDISKSIIPEIEKRLYALLSKIRDFAPVANINIIAYPMSLSVLKPALDDFFSSVLSCENKNPIQIIFNQLNGVMYKVASELSLTVINPYNEQYWVQNSTKLTSFYFDVHPNTIGYKKMAMDIYLKLVTPSRNVSNYYPYIDFTQQYLDSDLNLNWEIQANEDNDIVLGKTTDDYLHKYIPFVAKIDRTRNLKNYGERLIRLSQTFKNITKEVMIGLTTNQSFAKIDPNFELKDLILKNEDDLLNNDMEKVVNSGLIQNLLADFQKELVKLEQKDQLEIWNFKYALKKSLLKSENFFNSIRLVSGSNFLEKNYRELKIILAKIVNKLFKENTTTVINWITLFISPFAKHLGIKSNNIKKLLALIIPNERFIQIAHITVNLFVDNSDNLKNVKSYDELVNVFIYDEETIKKIANILSELIYEVLNNHTTKNIITDIFWNILTENNYQNNISKEQLEKVMVEISEDLSFIKSAMFKEVTSTFLKSFIFNLNKYGIENFEKAFIESIILIFEYLENNTSVDEKFSKDNIIKKTAGSKVIYNNKIFFRQLVRNILNKTSNGSLIDEFTNFIPIKHENLPAILEKYINICLSNYGEVVSKSASVILIDQLNEELGFKFNQDSDYDLFNEAIKAVLKSIKNTQELQIIIEKSVKLITNTDFSQSPNKLMLIINLLVKSFFSILTDKEGKISVNEIFNKTIFIKKILNNIEPQLYARFINRLFEVSNKEQMSGIYAILNLILSLPDNYHPNANTETKFSIKQKVSLAQNKIKKVMELNSHIVIDVPVYKIIPKLKKFMGVIFEPLFINLIKQNKTINNQDIINYKNTDGYKALYRFTTTILWILKDKINNRYLFWNASSFNLEKIFLDGTEIGFNNALNKFNHIFDTLNNDSKFACGAKYNSKSYNFEFITGNRSTWTTYKNYWPDQLLAYLHYNKQFVNNKVTINGWTIDKYSGNLMVEVLLNS
ncbi:GDSL-type esterase/lipase family protein [Mycoplasmopsis verecunda]|nr:GDSL-type esterase/lipase family protein [Mycoplasmopsis verecunda]WPB54461.1 GDSL-type esterase/lipase family protein [Mycoplasmopsis verecunda]